MKKRIIHRMSRMEIMTIVIITKTKKNNNNRAKISLLFYMGVISSVYRWESMPLVCYMNLTCLPTSVMRDERKWILDHGRTSADAKHQKYQGFPNKYRVPLDPLPVDEPKVHGGDTKIERKSLVDPLLVWLGENE